MFKLVNHEDGEYIYQNDDCVARFETHVNVGFEEWVIEKLNAAQQGVQLTGGTCAACGEGNVVYDGCCINCGVPATSN